MLNHFKFFKKNKRGKIINKFHRADKFVRELIDNDGIQISEYVTEPDNYQISNYKPVSIQNHFYRINCVDCLNRSGNVMNLIALRNLEAMFGILTDVNTPTNVVLRESFFDDNQAKDVWINNNNKMSLFYAGSHASKVFL